MAKKAGAPKGNKNNPYGAPAKYHTLEEVHELGEELLKYMDDRMEKENPIYHFIEWYDNVKKMSEKEWDSLAGRDCFVPYYEKARKKLAIGMMRDKNLAQSYGNRFITMYMTQLRQFEKLVKQEDAMADISAKLELDAKRNSVPNDGQLNDLISALKNLKPDS